MSQTTASVMCMDSGVGGLAVLSHILSKRPEQGMQFLGDTLWMPYGEKPLQDIQHRVSKVFDWLCEEQAPSVFIMACNTATVAALPSILKLRKPPFLILEPVSATAKWVNAHVQRPAKIGILATPLTVQSNRYLEILDPDFEVRQVACTGLASLIESGHQSGVILESLLSEYLEPLMAWEADILILGCTHYSFIVDTVKRLTCSRSKIVDSADILAQEAYPVLSQLPMSLSHEQSIYVTGAIEPFRSAMITLGLKQMAAFPIYSANIAEYSQSHNE
jgi:glutamate racemase